MDAQNQIWDPYHQNRKDRPIRLGLHERSHMKHEDIIKKLSLEEKCALLQGATTFGSWPNERAGIPAIEYSDGPNGVRHQAGAADHLGLNGSEPATCFPTAVTVANSWDPQLGEQVGAAMGEEAAAQGVDVLLGPGLCEKRNPLCGRNFEYFSEDPYLAGKMAAGYVRGIQSNGIAACPKHYAVNSQETRRQASNSVIDERTMRELYLTAFEIVVRESDPKTIMSSYNLVNGVYVNEHEHLLKDILRDEWGFDGAVITDWGGSNDHAAGVAAGSTFEMPAPGLGSVRELVNAVQNGTIKESDVDERVDEAIELILDVHPKMLAAPKSFDAEAHHQLARKAAGEGAVLLKNDAVDGEALLPLAAQTKVALIGDFAQTPRYQGAGSSAVNSTKVDSLLDMIDQTELSLVGFEPGFERHGEANASKRDAAIDLAKRADVVLLAMALDEIAESEGADRLNMKLNANQIELLEAVAKVNPKVVVLLSAGSCVESDWMVSAPAVLYCALGGQAGAGAALDLVCGKLNPSGKLTETWPQHLEDVPSSANFPADDWKSEYREGIYVGYRYFQTAKKPVAFPFGFGLSYTSFAYSNIEVSEWDVTFTVTNTGKVAGTEIAQVYVAKPQHTVFRAEQELKGFARIELEPGESKTVTVNLGDKAFRYFNTATNAWEVEGGTYELRVGASCEDIRLTAEVQVAGSDAPNPYEGRDVSAYETADVMKVSDASFEALLGHKIPAEKPAIDRNMCFRDLNHGRSPIFWIVWLVLRSIKTNADKSGKPNLNVLFIWNMPLRALAKMTDGMVNMRMVDAIVMEIRGFWIIGIIRLLVEFIVNLIQNSQLKNKIDAASKA